MFFTKDNAGYIRINYTSDSDKAQSINALAKQSNRPKLVYTHATMGGYRYPILEKLAEGKNFQILKCSLPGNDKHAIRELAATLKDPNTVYGYVDATTITIVQIEGWDRKTKSLGDYGWLIRSDQKTFKRVKTLNRPFRFWWNPDFKLRVAIVDDDDYVNDETLHDLDDETKERLLDGGIVISQRLFNECLANVEFPTVEGEITTSDGLRAAAFRERCAEIKTFNARIFGEFDWVSDTPFDKTGQLKAQAFVDVSGTCDAMNVDVLAARSAVKSEVSGTDTFVLLDPQTAKYRVNGDLQSIVNNPALFNPADVKIWIKKILLGAFEDLKQDKLMEHWFHMGSPEFDANNQIKFDQDDLITLTKWNARAWIMSGMSLKQSPWLFERMAQNILSIIKTTDVSKMRIPVPCAVRAQVISQSMASAAGEDFDIEPGYIRWNPSHQCFVVTDADWLEMYESHGGNDLDDFFVGYWRNIGGVNKVIITRSPNDYGEYSIFNYTEGDWCATETFHDGEVMEFPEVSDDPAIWPKRLSEAVRDGDIIYTGLPSDKESKPIYSGELYSIKDIGIAVENNMGSQSCVGANVNARTLRSCCVEGHRQVQLTTMEKCIDTGAQGGHMDDIQAVRDEATAIIKEILAQPAVKVDNYLWQTRFASLYEGELSANRLTSNTHVSRIHSIRVAFVKSFTLEAQKYVSANIGQHVDPNVHVLGKRFLRKGADLLKFARRAIAQSRFENGGSASTFLWDDIHGYIVREIEKLEKVSDQHDMILGLYSACLKLPTATTGRVSDQLVMNPMLFDRLMAALRFYGIAAHLILDKDGHIVRHKIDNWMLTCKNCGVSESVVDPARWQAHNYYDELCAQCMPK